MSSTTLSPVFVPDEQQQTVINLTQGHHLVLAPPGCGKTQILTERIKKALSEGISCEDMLCLTFTNRAARGMLDRIQTHIDSEPLSHLFVGNVHRFCSKFLFDYQLVPVGTSVIDDEDAMSILSNYFQEDEGAVFANYHRRKEYALCIQLSALMHQIKHQHPKELRLHADCFTPTDLLAFRTLCNHHNLLMNGETVIHIFEHNEHYVTLLQTAQYPQSAYQQVVAFLNKMSAAFYYHSYKKEHRLLDFEDLLLYTYDALTQETETKYKRYSWIQVDEVQDLNPLQLAIIHKLTAENNVNLLYLGDEQQAIFSFMGAKLTTLDHLKEQCKNAIYRLSTNHRSPNYLLEVFNTYAENVLHINKEYLSNTNNHSQQPENARVLLTSGTIDDEKRNVCEYVQQLLKQSETDTTAIIVNANNDADALSLELQNANIPHFKVSGEDLFSTKEVKLLLSHLGIIDNEFNFLAWARLLKGLHIFETNATCQKFITALFQNGIAPTDLLKPHLPTYLERFVEVYNTKELVIFDTETTGLNVLEDDIVQIAAVKIRNGKRVEGGQFEVFIRTSKPIPAMLGNIENPLVEAIKHHTLCEPHEALQQFLVFVGDSMLLAHNATYDYQMLRNNLSRYLPSVMLQEQNAICFDSLKLIKLVQPSLQSYKLKHLLEQFGLEGENSHLADADVLATISLVNYCYNQAVHKLPEQRAFLGRKKVMYKQAVLAKCYATIYEQALQQLYTKKPNEKGSLLVAELQRFYHLLKADGLINHLPKLHYVFSFLEQEMITETQHHCLASELQTHLASINTLKESDLCGSKIMRERVFISTIHKAKGLEFDNVIVYDAVDGRYPNFFHKDDNEQVMEDARKFYVALSRAKKRIVVATSTIRLGYNNEPIARQITPFMSPLLPFFTSE